MLNDIEFANPEYFWLLLILPVMIIFRLLRRRKQDPTLKMPALSAFGTAKKSLRVRLMFLPFLLRLISMALIITAIARPHSSSSRKEVSSEGIDIVIALDVSTSMLAEDFKPNRIKAAKETAIEFIKQRPNDRIGLVVFAGESFTQCPVTIDHKVLLNLLSSVKSGMLADGTAIGEGLATAVARLENSDAKSRTVILLTDGMNNSGSVSPLTAAEIAETIGLRVYTIGVGSKGTAPYPMKMRTWTGEIVTRYQNVPVEIDEEVLKDIAAQTDGQYFRATNNKALENIYKEIDELEKTKIKVAYFNQFEDKFLPWAIAAGIALFLEILLRFTVFRKNP